MLTDNEKTAAASPAVDSGRSVINLAAAALFRFFGSHSRCASF